ncbi:MAG: T9SS type A sorting domain-containing protein, partial [Salinimicrobium sp.]
TWSGDYISASGEFDADGLAADDYIVTYTYSDGNGCENSDTATVTVDALPEPPAYQTTQADCLGGNGGIVFLNVGDNMYYSINGGDFVLYDDEISLAEGFYDFRIRYGEDECISDEFEVEIKKPNADVVTLVPDVIQPDCDTFQGTIVITNAGDLGDLNYTVTNEDTNTDYYTSVAYPVGGFTGLPAGNYYVSAISDNGCISGNIRITLNEPVCDDFDGCTLGYWKNHTNRWCKDYQTCTSYVEAFFNYQGGYDDAPKELRDLTLQEVLNLGGGGVYNFGRQSVAALLNACGEMVDYELPTTFDVIDYVRNNVDTPGAAGSYLDMLNNAGCTMGGSRATTAPSDDCESYEKPKGKGNGKNKNAKATSDVSTFPVPFKETVNVSYDFDYTSDVTIQLFDMRGRHLRTYKDKKVTKGSVTTMNIDFALKANQIYILKVTTDRETFVKQIISSKK